MSDQLKLMISDEDPDSRVNTRKAVQRAHLDVVGEVGYGIQAVSSALADQPDILLVAVEEPVARPLETVESLVNALPETPIIVYSGINEPEAIRRAMVHGARDYLLRPIQAERLRDAVGSVLAQEERRQQRLSGHGAVVSGRGTVVTITGAKGGIGKTVISVNLAVALRRETGRSVAIFDADTQFGDVATMLNLTPERTLGDLLPVLDKVDRRGVQECLTRDPSGVEVLASPSSGVGWAGFTTDNMKRLLELLAQNYDFLIIDTTGSFDDLTRTAVEASTLTLVVTTAEVSTIRDTASALQRLEAWKIPPDRFKVVLNHGRLANGISVEDVRHALRQEIFWEVPNDRRVATSVQLGHPLVLLSSGSAAGRNLRSLALAITGVKSSAGPQKRLPVFDKLFKAVSLP